MQRHWLLVDIGNTHTVVGLALPGSGVRDLTEIRFRTDPHATADEYRLLLTQLLRQKWAEFEWRQVERAVISSVVPSLESALRQALSPEVPCLFISHDTRREFELELPVPSSLGADRLANVAGALAMTQGPLLIVDAGTATTFCLVDSRRRYLGGAIVPGLDTSWKALQARAAKLFSVQLIRPASALGNTTETQLQSGVLQGYEALIEGLTDRLVADAQALGHFENPTYFATGGIVNLLKLSSRFRFDPGLTLSGLLRYGELTQ